MIDVRSPAEFAQGHIPGAVNIPLFTNEERKVVGTAYKQESRGKAIKIGLDYFGPKMRSIVEEVEALVSSEQLAVSNTEHCSANRQLSAANSVFLYCWRGGMRSGAIAWLLQLYGFPVTVLAGGYKAFRAHVLNTFEQPFSFKVVGGYTGSGKTELLPALQEQGEAIIDLEALAHHKGSAFGNIGMPKQPTQEMFENKLSLELLAVSRKQEHIDPDSPFRGTGGIWIEDESQRIGQLNIPSALWKTLRSSPVYFLDIPFDERLKHIVEEYGAMDKTALSEAIQRISKRLGGLQTKEALRHLEEGALSDSFSILLCYYDKHYLKGLHNREGLQTLLTTIPCETVTPANAGLLTPITV
ncbi:MAG: mnmH [Flaviaesturariibacter sp.]|nr:mnmH [Flaviaesturariibacter sp.]